MFLRFNRYAKDEIWRKYWISYCFVIILLSEKIWYLKLEKKNWSLCAKRFDSIYNFPHRLLNFIPKLEPFLSRHSITTRVTPVNESSRMLRNLYHGPHSIVPSYRTSEASIHRQTSLSLVEEPVIYSSLASTTFSINATTPIHRVSANWQLTYLYDRIRNISYFLRSRVFKKISTSILFERVLSLFIIDR